MTIARVLEGRSIDVITCKTDMGVADAVAILAERRIGAMPVLGGSVPGDGEVIGILSERDIIYCLRDEGGKMLGRTVGEVMTTPAVTVTPDTPVLAAMSLMTRRRVRHLPVLDGGKLVGLASIGDLVKYRIDQVEAEAEAMRSYIQTA